MNDQPHEDITQAVISPMAQLIGHAAGLGQDVTPCGERFNSPAGKCGGTGKHTCNVSFPHIAHRCACGASDHGAF